MTITTKETREGYELSGKLKTVTQEEIYAFSGGLSGGVRLILRDKLLAK